MVCFQLGFTCADGAAVCCVVVCGRCVMCYLYMYERG